NALSRKTLPDLMDAALRGSNQAYAEVARPTADLVVPALSEHNLGQLMQMLMLATVVEGRLMGINPYGQPGVEAYKRNMRALLKTSPEKEQAGRGSAPGNQPLRSAGGGSLQAQQEGLAEEQSEEEQTSRSNGP